MPFESLYTQIRCLIRAAWKSSLPRDVQFSGMDHDDGNPQGTVKVGREASILDSVEEDSLIESIREKLRANEAVSVNMSHSVLLAAVITAAIAVLSGAMVFSSNEDGAGFPLDLPQRIESLLWKDRETEVEAFAGNLLTDKNPSEETRPLTAEPPDECPKEEARPENQRVTEALVVERMREKGRDPALPVGRTPNLLVTVKKGDTIHGILERKFGRSNKVLRNAVQALNPEIEDMNWIRVGQRIRLPLNLEVAYEIERIHKRAKCSAAERIDTSIEKSANGLCGNQQPTRPTT